MGKGVKGGSGPNQTEKASGLKIKEKKKPELAASIKVPLGLASSLKGGPADDSNS